MLCISAAYTVVRFGVAGWLTECVSVTFLSKVTSHDITLQCLKFVELADFLMICSNKNIALRNLLFDFGVVNTTYDDC